MIEENVTIKHLVDFSGDIYCDTTYTNEANNNTDEINPTFDSNKSYNLTRGNYFESSAILDENEAICNNCLLNIFSSYDDSSTVDDFIKEISENKFKKETITRTLKKANESYEQSGGNEPYDLREKFTPTEIYKIRNDIENNPDYPPQIIRDNKEPIADQLGFFLRQVFSEDRKKEEELDDEESIIYEDIYYDDDVRFYNYYMSLRFFRFPLSSDYTGGELSQFVDSEGFVSNRLLHYDYFEDYPDRPFSPTTKVSVRTDPIKYLYISDRPFFDYKIEYPEEISKWPKKAQEKFTESNFSDSYVHIQKYGNNKDVYSYCGYPSKFLSIDGQHIVHPYYLSKDGEPLTENPKIPKNKLCPLCESEFPETIDGRQPSLRK